MISDAFSATIIVGMLVLLHGIVGMIDASTTLSPCTPFTLEWKQISILKARKHFLSIKEINTFYIIMNLLLPITFSNQINSHTNLTLIRSL